jgi:glycosyltransferase involved in cell wall biosynthesis
MQIIFINRFFYPDHSATSQMLSDLAFALAGRGGKVVVITSRLRYDNPGARLPPSEEIDGVQIYRVATTSFGRHILAGRALDYATFYVMAAWSVLRRTQRGDLVVAKTDPPMLGLVCRPAARLRGAYFANWLQDIFPEVAVALGMNNPPLRSVFSFLRIFRDASWRKAEFNAVIGSRMAERLRAAGVKEDKIRLIPNWADTSAVRPVAPAGNPLRAEWGLRDTFVVGYSGNLGRAHEADTLLAAIALTEQNADLKHVRWLFVGGGAQLERLKAACSSRGLSSVRFQPYQPRERLAQSLSAADVHLVSLRPELEGLIVPSKFYGIAAAGRPAIFIGDADGEIARLLREHGCGVTVPQGDGVALAAAVEHLAHNPSLCLASGENGRRAAEQRFGIDKAVSSWEDALRTLPGS